VRQANPAALRDERGFTLVELIIVMIVVAVLIVIALSSYRGYRERANDVAAKENVYNALPAVSAYYVEHESYAGMTLAELKSSYNAGMNLSQYSLGSVAPTDATYCLESSSGNRVWRKNGPEAALERQSCP
jgi:prepilin-type N-terminal cleavage/methylation domain-containing protein